MSLPTSDPQPPSHQSHSPSASSPPRSATGSSFPFSFRRSIQPNPSSTSLAPSVAEGKPIPVDGSTVEYRTTALRELNHHYPSRHRYAKSTGAQNSTYSEPVIVRSYYPPLSTSRPTSSSRGAVVHSGAVSIAGSHGGHPAAGATRGLPFTSKFVSAGSGVLNTMVLARGKKPVNGRAEDETRLPPIEAFSFKSFLANMEAQSGGVANDINADLDRIAEICARSRYSLSNQYEVHYSPHGSGASFLTISSQPNDAHGPTLQAVPSEDERSAGAPSHKRRRMTRRNSRAMGTLETIMSSSRSSEDERSGKKKTAAEVADEIRGRASRKESGHTSPSNSSRGTPERRNSQQDRSPSKSPVTPKKSASSLALIDVARHSPPSVDLSAPRASATSLVSEPALPQESTSQLEIRTTPVEPHEERRSAGTCKGGHAPPKHLGLSVAKGAITPMGADAAGGGILSIINGWIPWRSSTASTQTKGLAEGSLRELLKTTDLKGKGLESE